MKRSTIHVNDYVRIVTPTFVRRVGYRLIWTDLVEGLANDPNVLSVMRRLNLLPVEPEVLSVYHPDWHKQPVAREFLIGLAKAKVRQQKFGGPERLIHTLEIPEAKDRIVRVSGKRVAKTGTYERGHKVSGWFDPQEYEPPSLADCQTHIILDTDYGEIESIHVEIPPP